MENLEQSTPSTPLSIHTPPKRNKHISIYRNLKIPKIILQHFDLKFLTTKNYDLR